ncbi:HCCA isomerase/glutathione S-transferase kappa [Xylariomycetidae sp. FL0641]|nr:HCCA isomerase/glutathione S-transferase kappa [Xylariomycetidae sp. FL0641]
MTPAKITLFVDVVSPFAYEAYHILRHDPVFRDVQVTYVPIFLGGLMKMCGNTAPMRIKNKDRWINRERVRWASIFGIPMAAAMPPDFPPNTVRLMRALSCAPSPDHLPRALDALYAAFWVRHADVAAPDVFAAILREVWGEAATETALAEAPTRGKTTLAANTDAAFAAGAFGLPWLACTNPRGETEAFWGVDHLGQVLQFLGLERPGARGWRAVL